MEKEKKFDKNKYDIEFHKNNYDRLAVVVPKGTKEILKKYCNEKGTNINRLINEYINSLLNDSTNADPQA